MSRKIAIVAALAGELKPLVQAWEASTSAGVHVFHTRLGEVDVVAAYAGIGREPAANACMQVLQGEKPAALISVGWAGALSCGMKTGNAYTVQEVMDAATGERYQTADLKNGSGNESKIRLVTTQRIAGRAEKQQLAESYLAMLVDMEAATVARLARVHDIPFYCIKAVSDSANEMLPDLNPYLTRSGKLRTGAFVASVLVRPRYWPALIRMGDNSRRGATALAAAVEQWLTNLPAQG